MSTLVVTGTDTGVGKTVATAALACCARLADIDVAVCKPVQTGSPRDDDLAEAMRLMKKHDTLAATRAEALDWAAKARNALAPLPDGQMKRLLVELSDFVVSRVV